MSLLSVDRFSARDAHNRELQCTVQYVFECTCNRTGKEMRGNGDLAGRQQGLSVKILAACGIQREPTTQRWARRATTRYAVL